MCLGKMTRRLYGILSLLFLLMGMGIYLFFRDMNMLLFNWIPKPNFIGSFSVNIKPTIFSSLFLYNFPDILWFLSGILFLRFIWFFENKWQNIYLLSFYVFAVIMEISQLSENVPGTFDILDLSFMGIGAFIEGLLYNFNVWRRLR